MVSAAWGFTNPFIRKATLTYVPRQREPTRNPVKKLMYTAGDLLRHPGYAIPLVVCNFYLFFSYWAAGEWRGGLGLELCKGLGVPVGDREVA
jgi:hypothetical protein